MVDRTLFAYIPKDQVEKNLPERLQKLAATRNRAVNGLPLKGEE